MGTRNPKADLVNIKTPETSWLTGRQGSADICTAPTGCVDARLVPGSPARAAAAVKTAEDRPAGAWSGLLASAETAEDGAAVLALLEQAYCAPHGQLPPAVQRWLQDGLRAYIDEGCSGELERHLELRVGQRAGRSLVQRLADVQRLRALAEAYETQTDDAANRSAWKRCEDLCREIEEFRTQFWGAWKDAGPPKGQSVSRRRRTLFAVFVQYVGAPPRSTKGVYEALQRAGVLT